MGGLKAFASFWWDFLVGDTPELFVSVLAVVGVAFSLAHERIAAIVALPALTAVMLLVSTWRGRRRHEDPAAGD